MYQILRASALCSACALLPAVIGSLAPARGETPPGFVIRELTDNPQFELVPKINNLGQVVYLRSFGRYADSDDLYFFDGRRHIRITNDETGYIWDAAPDINDDGTIVWSRAIGPDGPYGPTTEVMLYRNGEISQLTDNDTDDWTGSINSLGHVAWYHYFAFSACSGVSDIFTWDGRQTQRISWDGEGSDGISNASPQLNDAGDIVWTRYDFCQSPWASTIQLYRDGQIERISGDDEYEPQVPALSNCGVAAWDSNDASHEVSWLMTWKDGVRTIISDWGSNAHINCRGDIYFIRWHEDLRAWQAWYYSDGVFYHLSEGDPTWNTDGDVNEDGECVWSAGGQATGNIRYLSRPGRKLLERSPAGARRAVESVYPVEWP